MPKTSIPTIDKKLNAYIQGIIQDEDNLKSLYKAFDNKEFLIHFDYNESTESNVNIQIEAFNSI